MTWLGNNIVAAIFSIGFVAPIAWMVLDRDPPYIRESGAIVPHEVQQGGRAKVEWVVRVRKACPKLKDQNVDRVIVDAKGKRHFFEPIFGIYGTRVQSSLSRDLSLPDDIAVGPATYRSKACFACNPMQYFFPVCVDTPDLEFVVVSKP